MAHGDSVANANGLELKWYAARHPDACFYGLGYLIQMNMSRNEIVRRIGDSYEGASYLLIRDARSF
jgi:hypothetical protein